MVTAALGRLLKVPHRLAFMAGLLPLLPLMIWWGGALAGWWHVGGPGLTAHAQLMTMGFFPLFMMGFIFTAGPKWLNVTAPRPAYYVPAILLYLSGTVLLALSAMGVTQALPWAQLFHALGWAIACGIWIDCIRRSRVADAIHAKVIATAFVLGLGAHLLKMAGTWWPVFLHAFVPLALFGFLFPVFLAVSHRMVPFFSSAVLPQYRVWRPYSLLYFWLVALVVRVGLAQWLPMFTWLVDWPLALSFTYCLFRWQSWRSGEVRLLAMLHCSFAWLPVAFALLGYEAFLRLMAQPVTGSAGTHALTVGFFTSMLYAFVTRVSLGHSGRPLIADGLLWAGFLALLCVALLRVLAALFPAVPGLIPGVWIGWCVIFGYWIVRFAPVYWRARADGNPG